MDKKQAVDQFLSVDYARTQEELFKALDALWEAGHTQGMLDVDSKLAEALKGLQRGNSLAERLKVERDAILEEYSRISWTKVIEGALQSGYHPPAAHAVPRNQAKIGKLPCRKCKPDMVFWDAMTAEARSAKMKSVWAAVMKARAQRIIDKSGLKLLPTTHELAGAGQPIAWEPLDVEALRAPRTKDCKDEHRSALQPPGSECECKCSHLGGHCCRYHCCCFRDYPQVTEREIKTGGTDGPRA